MRHKYKKPPLAEAVCEVVFTGVQWDSTIWGLYYERIREIYPIKQEIPRIGLAMQFKPGMVNTQGLQQEPLMRFAKSDNTQLIQVAKDFLTINQLSPYPGFELFKEDIGRAIESYCAVASPIGVGRIGLRYINRITIPATDFSLDTYFRFLPGVPDDVATTINSFMTRVEIVPQNQEHSLQVTIGTTTPPTPGNTGIVLDIYDSLMMPSISIGQNILDSVHRAHDNIEHVFEGVITDHARKLFQEVNNEYTSS